MKIIVGFGILVAIVIAYVFGPNVAERYASSSHGEAGDPSIATNYVQTCNLLAGPCGWDSKGAHWKVELLELDDDGDGTEYQLSIETSEKPERFLAVLRGESMYMGEYPVPMKETSAGVYQARFTAPLCTVDSIMIWRIDLQSAQAPIPSQQTKLTFEAEGH